jgi:hypothetical protein
VKTIVYDTETGCLKEHRKCEQCGGSGWYTPPDQRGTIHGYKCPACCKHELGRERLNEFYGKHNGKWVCVAGCGKLWKHPDELRSAIAAVLAAPRERDKRI